MVALLLPLEAHASFPADAMDWKDRLMLSAHSDKIYLIKVGSVVWGNEETKDGVKLRKFKIEAKVIEVLRGEEPENSFIHNDVLTSYVDPARGASEVIGISPSRMTGAADCEEGQRYVVIYFEGLWAFIPIIDGDAWRTLIRPRVPDNLENPALAPF